LLVFCIHSPKTITQRKRITLMKVFTLLHVSNPEHFQASTLCLSTIWQGFPDANITAVINANSLMKQAVIAKCDKYCVSWTQAKNNWFHADFLWETLLSCTNQYIYPEDEPLVFVDGDTMFFSDMTPLFYGDMVRGMHIPEHMNEFSNCVSAARLHSSFLIIPSPRKLLQALKRVCHKAFLKFGEYQGFKPFHPTRVYQNGAVKFYDTGATLYHSVYTSAFDISEHDVYAHVNSASFYSLVADQFNDEKDRESFRALHHMVNHVGDQTELEHRLRDMNLNRKVRDYYLRRIEIRSGIIQ
jgi:hypothetical protein